MHTLVRRRRPTCLAFARHAAAHAPRFALARRSQSAIYALHRGEVDKASELIAQGKEEAKQLLAMLVSTPTLRFGALSSALEEWAEAAIFAVFLKERRIATMAELEIGAEGRLRSQPLRCTSSMCCAHRWSRPDERPTRLSPQCPARSTSAA